MEAITASSEVIISSLDDVLELVFNWLVAVYITYDGKMMTKDNPWITTCTIM
jgi:hypothetical protein